VAPGRARDGYGVDMELPRERIPVRLPGPKCDDAALGLLVLVADGEPAQPVVHAARQPRGPHVVERVHRGDHPECRGGDDLADARHYDPAVRDRHEQRVERVLRCAVELLDVEEAAVAHGEHQRPRHEVVGAVVLAEYARRMVVADQLDRRQLRVAFHERERDVPLVGDGLEHGGLARAGRALEDDVPPRGDCSKKKVELVLSAHDVERDAVARPACVRIQREGLRHRRKPTNRSIDRPRDAMQTRRRTMPPDGVLRCT
jgi:hypothetical protein